MTDPIEAAARYLYENDIFTEFHPDEPETYWDKQDADLHKDYRRDAKGAIDAYHAAQPSDYAELKDECRHRISGAQDPFEEDVLAAIEALEASLKISHTLCGEQAQRAEAAEAHAKDQIEAYESLEQEFKELQARVGILETEKHADMEALGAAEADDDG